MNNIKKTIIAKNIKDFRINEKINKTYIPVAGDLAVFKVIELGKHESIQGENENNTYIFPGDYIMAAFGNRYATGQFEGYVPNGYYNEYHLLGKGGAVGILASMHYKLKEKGTTNLKLVGYVTDNFNNVINSKYYKQEIWDFNPFKNRPYEIILSLGTSMDSGKTTTAGFLTKGLKATQKVAFIKLTGTVYTRDKHFVRDCGADISLDFSTFGFPSTYKCDMIELLNLYESLLHEAESVNPDYIIVEIADGLLQRETNMLLNNASFMSTVDHVIFSAADSLGILSGIQLLKGIGVDVFAVSGLFTASPLLVKEVSNNISHPVLTLDDLAEPKVLKLLEKQTIAI